MITKNNELLVVSPLVALMAPFLVWIIEQFFPFPYLVEELIKAGFAYFIILATANRKRQILIAILTAILFSLSETVLYLFNLSQLNIVQLLMLRLVFTGIMHVVTLLVMVYLGGISKKLLPVGVIIAVLLHFLYNLFVSY